MFSKEFLSMLIKTLPRDFKGIRSVIRIDLDVKKFMRRRQTVGSAFEALARRQPAKIAITAAETGKEWRYSDVNALANRVSNYFAAKGLKRGDSVALFMNNCPEYVCMWLGLSRLGVISALINYNLRQEPLSHSIRIASAKAIICDEELVDAVLDISRNPNDVRLPVYAYGQTTERVKHANGNDRPLQVVRFANELIATPSTSPPAQPDIDSKSTLFYIYTSGTTGLPKAAVISHARYFMMARGTAVCLDFLASDRFYLSMPLYHSAAGVVGTGQLLVCGASIVIRKSFSASKFFEDCARYHCTIAQYIGELCRYLLAQPPGPYDAQHGIRMMFGNGMRRSIWQEFSDRFKIAKIGEFYGSTEGNNSMMNMDFKFGACGFLPPYTFLSPLYPVALIKIDESTGEHLRSETGLCIRCKPGESGELISRIVPGNPFKDFKGYVSDKDTSKKVIRDVLRKGDLAFSSGDIFEMDRMGYLYFKDRVGDTFRWKGENVSTCEVEAALQKALGHRETSVYGVAVPGCEGRAGMAAISGQNPEIDPNLGDLAQRLAATLPAYARPVFVRLCKQVEMTGLRSGVLGTFKLKKVDLQKQGFNPEHCGGDLLFYLNPDSQRYEPISAEVYARLAAGAVKL